MLQRVEKRLYDYSISINQILVKIDELDRDNLQMNEALDRALMKLVDLRRKYRNEKLEPKPKRR